MGEKIGIRKDGTQKVTSHSMGNDAHLKSITAIPSLIENAIFIDELPNEKGTVNMIRTDIMFVGFVSAGLIILPK